MVINDSQGKLFTEGVLGDYYTRGNINPHHIAYEPIISSGIEIEYGRLYIPGDKLAALCTELIEMARVLGVTGGPDGA